MHNKKEKHSNAIDMMANIGNTLFSQKEMYLTLCGKNGKFPVAANLSEHYKRKKKFENLHLFANVDCTAELGLPVVAPYTDTSCFETVYYGKRNEKGAKDKFVHFFKEDYAWAYAMWYRLEATMFQLKDYRGVIAPDYTLYVDVPKSFNIMQLLKNRVATVVMQKCGFQVIPTASFGNASSIEYCFDGLPCNSVIAICGTGLESRTHRNAWEYAVSGLIEQKRPTLLIVYGKPFDLSGLQVPVRFIEDEVSLYHRK